MAATRDRVTPRRALAVAGILLVGLVAGPGGTPAAAQSSIDVQLQRRLQDVIDLARTDRVVPGISAAVATPADVWTGVTGMARFDPDEPVGPGTPFSIGSVTKTFVATVILQLREEGSLSLGDHLSRWEAKIPNAGRITVRQLLSHTSGVRDIWWHPMYQERVEGRPAHVWTYPEVRAMIGPSRFRPGARFEYSNSNYILLGRIVELVTGHSVAHEIRTRLLVPLALNDTWYQGADEGPRTVAMGYERRNGGWIQQGDGSGLRPTTSIATYFGAAGAMISTARDLSTWARALYGGHVLQPPSLTLMTTFNAHDYGLGTRRKVVGGRTVWGHGGSLDGFETSMWYLPDLDTAVVVIWNRRDLDTDPVAGRLARRVVNALDPDVTPPTLTGPRVSLQANATVGSGYAPVVITWSAAHDGQGSVVAYDARRQVNGGEWRPIRLASPTARRVALSLHLDRAAIVAIRATDDRGNVSDWVESRPLIPRFLDETDPAIRPGAGWRSRTESDALGGHVLASVRAGSRMKFRVRAAGIAIVGPRSRALTRSWVRVDGRPAVVVSAHASPRRARQTLLARRWSGEASGHTIRILVRPDPHARAEVDGFLVLQDP